MERQFTAGVERVLAEAARWSSGNESDELSASQLLLGLLAEGECRAAIVLACHGIDSAAVCRRWPDLFRLDSARRARRFSAEVEASLSAAVARLHEYPRPLVLATEHLLLGLVAAGHETSVWLREHGLEPDALEAEIHRQYGYRPGPLPVEERPLNAALQTTTDGEDDLPDGGDSAAAEAFSDTEDVAGQRAGTAHCGQPPPGEPVRLLRVLDAAANRAREGLRVAEDYVRFVLDDRHLTDQLKGLRHELTAALSRISPADRLAARETQADVGTALSTHAERRRCHTSDVLSVNFARLQESLRSLEEFGKLLDAELAAELERLRYRTYTLQRAVEITAASVERLAGARLYVLIDGRSTPEEFEALAWSLVEAGVDVVQLRDKWLDDRRLYERARLLRQITRKGDTLFVMNDRPDLAALTHADGVHVGQEELTVKDARTIVGPAALIGVSTHSVEQARQAVLDGANYIGVGPVFASETKDFDEYPGVELLRAVAEEVRLPAFAIGGVNRDNLAEVLAAGFRRVAVSSAVTAAADPAAAARQLLAALEEQTNV